MTFFKRLVADPLILVTTTLIFGQIIGLTGGAGITFIYGVIGLLALFALFGHFRWTLICALGIVIGFIQVEFTSQGKISSREKGVVLDGVIASLPRAGLPGQLRIEFVGFKKDVGGSFKLRCTTQDLPWRNGHYIKSGARVTLQGDVSPFRSGSFSRQLLRRGFDGECKARYVSMPRYKELRVIDSLRFSLNERLESLTSNNESGGIIKALLLGQSDGVSRGFERRVKQLGISHLFVVSGLHVGILFTTFAGILRMLLAYPAASLGAFRVPKLTSLLFGIITIWIYIIVLGLPTSGVRAAIALTIAHSVQIFSGSAVSFLRGMLLSCLLLCSIWPGVFEELGFQLTYAALTGLWLAAYFSNYFVEIFGKKGVLVWFSRSFLYAFFPSVFTGMILLFTLSEFAPLATFGNLFVAPLVLIIGFMGSIWAVGISFIIHDLGKWMIFNIESILTNFNLVLIFIEAREFFGPLTTSAMVLLPLLIVTFLVLVLSRNTKL